MGRKTVRVDIPTRFPKKFTRLIEDIWRKHEELGASSPLFNNPLIDMSKYETKMTEALQARAQAEEHYALAQALMEKSRNRMGIDKGQSINHDGLYNYIDTIKRILLIKHPLEEEGLSPWGFNVVVRSAKNPVRKKKPLPGG